MNITPAGLYKRLKKLKKRDKKTYYFVTKKLNGVTYVNVEGLQNEGNKGIDEDLTEIVNEKEKEKELTTNEMLYNLLMKEKEDRKKSEEGLLNQLKTSEERNQNMIAGLTNKILSLNSPEKEVETIVETKTQEANRDKQSDTLNQSYKTKTKSLIRWIIYIVGVVLAMLILLTVYYLTRR